MDRTEAIIYLKEVLTLCGEMTPESVYLENSKNIDSSGYRVHIKGKILETEMQKIREIAEKHSLEIEENPDGIIIYNDAQNILFALQESENSMPRGKGVALATRT